MSQHPLDLVLIGKPVGTHLIDAIATLVNAESVKASPPAAIRLHTIGRSDPGTRAEVAARCAAAQIDFAFVPSCLRLDAMGLLATDMDSTLISIECIDEVADFAGKKKEVAAITEQAMQGKLDYSESLRQRVALLEGLSESVLERVFAERLQLNPGAATLVRRAAQLGVKTMLVSGGFSYFTARLQQELGFDYATANTLEIVAGRLTGRVLGDIVDAAGKAAHVAKVRDQLGLSRDQVITLGDGANDLLMMAESGISVAYHAKPLVREHASVALDHAGLDGVLALFDGE